MLGLTFDKIENQLIQSKKALEEAERILETRKEQIKENLKKLFIGKLWEQIDENELTNFIEKPYMVRPIRESEYEIVVPKFYNIYPGALVYQDRAYNVFRVNRYMTWISEIPEPLREELDFKEPEYDVKLLDNKIMITPDDKVNDFLKKFKSYVAKRDDGIYVKEGKKFSIVLELLKMGILPFTPREVTREDLTDFEPFELRDYQKKAWKKFLEHGHIGLFIPFGAGKSFFGLYALGRIKGDKLVIAPSTFLVEQWINRIEDKLGDIIEWIRYSDRYIATKYGDIQIATYSTPIDKLKYDWSLVVFDECHRLPANVYSVLAGLPRKYSIGLSASPFREDGRTEYIYALTGFPVGTDWRKFFEMKIVSMPEVTVIITEDKMKTLAELLQRKKGKKILIYSDYIKSGKEISKKFNIPFVHGGTRKKFEAFVFYDVVACSRIGDEGISFPDLDCVIEVEFLFGSRRQSSQRVGRLFHSKKLGKHYILMTNEEYKKYKKRLYVLMEKGIKVKVEY